MNWTRAALFAVLIASFGLRAHGLGFQSIWTDEGFIVGLASRGFGELVGIWNVSPQEGYASLSRLGQDLTGLAVETDIHPPLYYFLVHFWMLVTGSREYTLRFPAVFFGVLTVPLLYAWGKRLAGRGAALFGAGVAMLSPFYLDFSQQVRMYTLMTFLALLSMYSFEKALRDRRHAQWIVYALATGLALYVHYFVVTVVLVQAVIVAVAFFKERRFQIPGYWLASIAGAGLIFLPWAPYALRQVFDYQNRSLLSPDWQTVFSRTWQTFNLGVTVDPGQVAPLLVGILVFLAAGLGVAWRTREARPGLAAVLLYFLVPILAGLAILRLKPMFHPKYFMMASPAYYLLLGAAVSGLWRNLRWASVPVALFVLGGLGFGVHSYFGDSRYYKDDTRALGRYLEGQVTDRDLVLSDLIEPLGYYYHAAAPAYYLPGDQNTAPGRVGRLARDRQRVFLVHYEHSYTDPQGLIPFLLERASDRVVENAFRGYTLREYTLRPGAGFELGTGTSRSGSSFEGQFTLAGALVGGEQTPAGAGAPEVPSGGRLWALLDWRVEAPVLYDYKASLALVDGRGHLAAQKDSLILRGMDPTSHWRPGEQATNYYVLPIFPGVAPGEYNLRLSVYAASPGAPEGLPAASNFSGGQIELGKVMVGAPRLAVVFRPEDMGVQVPARMGAIEGLGFTLVSRQFRQGESVPLTLFMKTADPPREDIRLRFELRDGHSATRSVWESPPKYPASKWKKGDGYRDWQDLPLPGSLAAGEYRLVVGVTSPSGEVGTDRWDLGRITVVERPRVFAPPPIDQPVRAEMGGRIAFLGFEIEGDPRPGGTVQVTLYWQALAAIEQSYAVFAHLLDSQNQVRAQHDGTPGGDIPTSGWLQGEVVVDRRTLQIGADTPPGDYMLEVGMYDPVTGRRLAVSDAPVRVVDDALWLRVVTVG